MSWRIQTSICFCALAFFRAPILRATDAVPGELLIKFREDVSPAQRNSVLARRGAEVIRHFATLGIDHVRLTNGRSAKAAARTLAAEENILYAQPNYIRHTNADSPPDDPRWLSGELWGMIAIHADAAWSNFTTGSAAVVVMDIDSGANYNHPDLAANIWTNPCEIAGNGLDDDGDGYIDDVHGINPAYGNTDPLDDDPFHNHGTHTAGTIAALGNNGVGVVGVSWNSNLIPCKAFSWQGDATDSAIIQCFDYAIALKQRGVNIRATNNSYGGGLDPGDPFPDALKDAFDRSAAAGIVNVCAAGNNASNNDTTPYYPAGFNSPGLIAVAASGGANDNVASFSNYGRTSVDLAAPGDGILSTQFNDYGTLQGTSMSTPHVTGAIALLTALQAQLSVETAKSLILNNVDVLPQWSGLVATGGRLNVASSLRSAVYGQQPFSVASVARPDGNTLQLSWPCAPGLRYQVYATNNLTSDFLSVDSILTAAAGQITMSYEDTSATRAPKFYHVRTVP